MVLGKEIPRKPFLSLMRDLFPPSFSVSICCCFPRSTKRVNSLSPSPSQSPLSIYTLYVYEDNIWWNTNSLCLTFSQILYIYFSSTALCIGIEPKYKLFLSQSPLSIWTSYVYEGNIWWSTNSLSLSVSLSHLLSIFFSSTALCIGIEPKHKTLSLSISSFYLNFTYIYRQYLMKHKISLSLSYLLSILLTLLPLDSSAWKVLKTGSSFNLYYIAALRLIKLYLA